MQQALEKALSNVHPETARIIMAVSINPVKTVDADEAVIDWLTSLISE